LLVAPADEPIAWLSVMIASSVDILDIRRDALLRATISLISSS